MKLLSRFTTSRNAASIMLAVWLFVLASGFANACLLEAPDHGGQLSSSESSHTTSHAAAPAHDTEQSSKAPCLKACDEGSQALQGGNGMDFTAMVRPQPISFPGFLAALLVLSTWALLAGMFFSWLQNRLAR